MNTKKIISRKQLQAGPLVVLPRTQIAAAENDGTVQQQEFRAYTIQTEGTGTVWLLEQAEQPQMVFQIFTADNEEEFDTIMGKLLGMNERPSYAAGQTNSLALFQGNREHIEITQQNHRQVYDYIGRIQNRAAIWWSLFAPSL